MGPQTIVDLVGNIGTVAVLVWLVIHVFKTLIPKMGEDSFARSEIQRKSGEAAQAAFFGALKVQREQAEAQAERHSRDMQAITAALINMSQHLERHSGMDHSGEYRHV